MTLLKTLLATALVAASLVSGAHAQDRTIKFAFQNPKDHPQAQGAQKFADLVAAKSGGKIQVKLFPGGTLGGDLQTVSALQGGTVEMTVLNAGILSAQTKEFGIYDFPFLFANEKEADAIVDGPIGQKMHAALADRGIVGLSYWELGFRNMTTKEPLNSPAQAKGMKLRTFPNEMMRWSLESMGFTIQIMPLPEVFLAIQQGAVQGQENPIDTIFSNKFYEVAPNITLTNHVYSPIPLAVSEKTWQKLSPADQKAITEAAKIAGKFSREMIAGNDDNQLKEMSAKGAKVNAKPDLAAFREAVKPAYDKAREKYGADVDKVLAEAEAIRKTTK